MVWYNIGCILGMVNPRARTYIQFQYIFTEILYSMLQYGIHHKRYTPHNPSWMLDTHSE